MSEREISGLSQEELWGQGPEDGVIVSRSDLAWALRFMSVDGGHTRAVKGRLQAAIDGERCGWCRKPPADQAACSDDPCGLRAAIEAHRRHRQIGQGWTSPADLALWAALDEVS